MVDDFPEIELDPETQAEIDELRAEYGSAPMRRVERYKMGFYKSGIPQTIFTMECGHTFFTLTRNEASMGRLGRAKKRVGQMHHCVACLREAKQGLMT